MRIKTSELTRHALDGAVAKCQKHWAFEPDGCDSYSTDWALAGPIIEQEKIAIRFDPECAWLSFPPIATWLANYEGVGEWAGPTPLVAAMRCYVARKLGDEVDVPEELL